MKMRWIIIFIVFISSCTTEKEYQYEVNDVTVKKDGDLIWIVPHRPGEMVFSPKFPHIIFKDRTLYSIVTQGTEYDSEFTWCDEEGYWYRPF